MTVGELTDFVGAKAGYYVPVASLMYAVGSFVHNPFATIRAAQSLMRKRAEAAAARAKSGKARHHAEQMARTVLGHAPPCSTSPVR